MRVRPLATATLLALFLAPLPALAQATSPEGAARLKSMVEQRLAEMARGGADELRLDGVPPVQVRPAGETYLLTVPGLRVLLPGGWLVEANMVEAVVTPQDGGGFAIDATVPRTLAVFGDQGFRAGEVAVGSQQFRGRLTADLSTLDALDARYGNLVFTPRTGQGASRLGSFAATLVPQGDEPGKWTGPATLSVADLSARGTDGKEWLALKRLQATVQVAGLDTAKYALWNAALARRAAVDDGKDGLSAPEAAALQPGVPALDGLLSRLDATVEVSGLKQAGDAGKRFAIADGTWSLQAAGLNADRARVALAWKHKGLAAAGPEVQPGLVPATGEGRLTATGLPPGPLLDAFAQRLADTAALGDRAASAAFRDRAVAALGKAGAQVTLDKLALDSPDAGLDGSGTLRFDAAAPRGVVGALSLLLRGMDGLVARVSAAGNPANPGPTLALYALQGLAKVETDAAGRPQHAYRLDIQPDGRILLNGNDATALLTGLASLTR